jgi:hypothetical protein
MMIAATWHHSHGGLTASPEQRDYIEQEAGYGRVAQPVFGLGDAP